MAFEARWHATDQVPMCLSRKLGAKRVLSLDVLNLLDRSCNDIEYFYATQLKSESAPVNDKRVHPGEPRSLRLRLRAQF